MTTTDRSVERYADVDLYGALHLTAEASAELVDKAYRLRLLEVHPDLAGAARTDQATLVDAAGEILRQPTARARYDALRAAHRARAGPSQATPDEAQRQRQRGRRARWLWASGAGGVAGAIALSVVLGTAGSRLVRAAPAPVVVPAPALAAVARLGRRRRVADHPARAGRHLGAGLARHDHPTGGVPGPLAGLPGRRGQAVRRPGRRRRGPPPGRAGGRRRGRAGTSGAAAA